MTSDLKKGSAQIIEPKMKEWLPEFNTYTQVRDTSTKALLALIHPDGSRVDIVTHRQTSDSHEGWDGDVVLFDEPPPREIFIANVRGLVDRGGLCYMAMTVLHDPWVVSDLYEDKFLEGDQDIAFFFTSMDDNPYLRKRDIETFCSFLDDDEIEARRHGRLVKLEGKIFKTFRHDIHVVDLSNFKIPPDWTRYMVMDPHDGKPTWCAWAAISPPRPESILLWYREALIGLPTIADIAKHIHTLEKLDNDDVFIRYTDPNFSLKRYLNSGKTVLQEYGDKGLYFVPANDEILSGHDAVKKYLSWDKNKPLCDKNSPKMYFGGHLQNLIKCVERYSYMPSKGEGIPLKIDPKFKDGADLVRYLCVMAPEWYEQERPYALGKIEKSWYDGNKYNVRG